MPFYEYACEACGREFGVMQAVTFKSENTACPYCNERKAKKLLSSFSSPGGEHSVCDTGASWGGG